MSESYKLNEKQIKTLKLFYKFRFLTVDLIANLLAITRSTANTNLLVLERRGFLNRHYKPIYKLDRKAARYYLSNKGIKELKQNLELNDGIVRSYYKNKSVSEPFITHNLNIAQAYTNFNKHYPKRFTMLTKAEMANHEQFPPNKPDLFLQDSTGKQYFLYMYEDTQLWVIQKHIKQLIEHCDDEEWPGTYPDILIACPNSRIEYKLGQYLESKLEDFEFLLTTTKALTSSEVRAIWSLPPDSQTLKELV